MARERSFYAYLTSEEIIMGEFKENVKGVTNDAIGNTKQVVGEAVDSPELEVEGEAQEGKANAQYEKGDIEEAQGNDV